MIESIENRWDILYRDYPEVYEELTAVPYSPLINFEELFALEGRTIADVGSGTGASTFTYAAWAKEVIGVEIEPSMLRVAQDLARARGVINVRFVLGDARSLPLEDNQVDAVIGSTLAIYPPEGFRAFTSEAERVTGNGGTIVLLNVAPGWYGGDLAHIIDEDTIDEEVDRILEDCGYDSN